MKIEYSCELVPRTVGKIMNKYPASAGLLATLAHVFFSLLSFWVWVFLLLLLLVMLDEKSWPLQAAKVLSLVFSVAMFLTCAMLLSGRSMRKMIAKKIHPRATDCTRKAPARVDYSFTEDGFERTCRGLCECFPWEGRFTRFFMDDNVLILYKGCRAVAIVPRKNAKGNAAGPTGLAPLLTAAGLKGKDKSTNRPSAKPASPITAESQDDTASKPAATKRMPVWAKRVLIGLAALLGLALAAAGALVWYAWNALDDGMRPLPKSIHIPFLWGHKENGVDIPDEIVNKAMGYMECAIPDGNFAITIPGKCYSVQPTVRDFPVSGSIIANRQWIFPGIAGPWMISVGYLKKADGETFLKYSEGLKGEVFEPIRFGEGGPALIGFGPGRTISCFSSLQVHYAICDFIGNGVKIIESGMMSTPDARFMEKHGATGCGLGQALAEIDGFLGRVFIVTIVRGNEAWSIQTFLPSSSNSNKSKEQSFASDMLYAGDIIGTFRILDD